MSCLAPPVTLSRNGWAVMRRALMMILSRPTCQSLERRVGGDAAGTILSRSTLPGSMKQGRDRAREGYSSSSELIVIEDGEEKAPGKLQKCQCTHPERYCLPRLSSPPDTMYI